MSHQLFKFNLSFCFICVFNLQFAMFLRQRFIHNRLFNANFDAKFNLLFVNIPAKTFTNTCQICSGQILKNHVALHFSLTTLTRHILY
jgi:hypothetical protein